MGKVKTVYAGHAMEIPYVMNCATMNLRDCAFGDAASGALAQSMADYWYNFAVSGDPNSAGAVTWPKYTAQGDQNLRFDVAAAGGVSTQSGLRKEACDFWDAQPLPPPPVQPV